jgi:hypothetical protein
MKHHRGTPSTPAQESIDHAGRMLRLPTIRGQFGEPADAAGRDQISYLGLLAEHHRQILARVMHRPRRPALLQRPQQTPGRPRDPPMFASHHAPGLTSDPVTVRRHNDLSAGGR